ncbi:MAG: hypothetical protein R2883_00020 [Caldisericia bacterium]
MTEESDLFEESEGKSHTGLKIFLVLVVLMVAVIFIVSIFKNATATKNSHPFDDDFTERIEKILEEFENK